MSGAGPIAAARTGDPAQIDVPHPYAAEVHPGQRAVVEAHPIQLRAGEVRLDQHTALERDVLQLRLAQIEEVDLPAAHHDPLQHRSVHLNAAEPGVQDLHVA